MAATLVRKQEFGTIRHFKIMGNPRCKRRLFDNGMKENLIGAKRGLKERTIIGMQCDEAQYVLNAVSRECPPLRSLIGINARKALTRQYSRYDLKRGRSAVNEPMKSYIPFVRTFLFGVNLSIDPQELLAFAKLR